jgi:type IV secretory pathway TrbD component
MASPESSVARTCIEPEQRNRKRRIDLVQDGVTFAAAVTQIVDPWLAQWGLLLWSLAVVVLGARAFLKLRASQRRREGCSLSACRECGLAHSDVGPVSRSVVPPQ